MDHEFVETLPVPLRPGIVYVSIKFATAAHLCCCGCGYEVVTPLSPVQWQVTFDGRSISLYPSVGNWALPCRSHYWIRNNEVLWAEDWSSARVARATAAQQRAVAHDNDHRLPEAASGTPATSRWRRLVRWVRSRRT